MRKERASLYMSEGQQNHWEKRSREEDLPMAEAIRRARDAYLAWDDPTYQPHGTPAVKERAFLPAFKDGAFCLGFL
ncbi:MAG TPA: CopG family transcriptional regulator [Ktedonobacteraceae bacterium]|nr:CopG family transcriptional regulator [Ktedonobacteraceae bacterium]